jgi:putative ABC transport system permease protein
MKSGRISTIKIALNNILHRRFRSVCIVLLTAITTALITGGTFLGAGLRNGINSINARLGADAMIIPQSAGESFEGALLSGSPSTFYLTRDLADRIMQLEGIERATSQLFISTFDSDHCASLVQIIGYDPKTDFVITPWLKGSKVAQPSYGEVVTGGNVFARPGDKIKFFSVDLVVVGVLERTGMGFDNSVFVNMDTAVMLLGEYEKFYGALPLPEGTDANNVVSAVLLDIKKDTSPSSFQGNIYWKFRDEGIRYISSKTLLASTAKNLNLVIGILTFFLAAVWVFAVFALAIIFSLALNERKKEFGILRAIGATRKKLSSILFCEASLLSLAGAFCGLAFVCLVVFPYNALIERVLQTAYLPPGHLTAAAILALGFALGAAIGSVASVFSAARIGKSEVLANIREGL